MNIFKGESARRIAKYLAIAVFCLVIAYYVYSYIFLNTLSVYDASGHLLAVHNAKAFWPSWFGWSLDMLGWAQGSTYPPAVHWLMAGFAKIIGDEAAIKTVVVLSIIALPITIWQYLKTISYSKVGGFVVFVFLFVIMIAAPDYFGSSLKSLFNLGLITNFVALPILFLHMAYVEKLNKDDSVLNIIFTGILMAILIWSHLVIALIGVLYLSILFVDKLTLKFKIKDIIPILKSVAVAGLLCLPFIIQAFLLKSQASSGDGIVSLMLPNLITLMLSLPFIYINYRNDNMTTCRLFVLAAILALICFTDALLVAIFGSSFIIGKLHVYRFQIFAYLFFTLAASGVIVHNLNNIFKKQEVILWLVPVLFLIMIAALENPHKFNYVGVSLNNINSVSGRFLETFSRKDSYPAPYAFQSELSRSNEKANWSYGLFIESAPNAPFIKSLSKSLSVNSVAVVSKNTSVEEVILPVERQKQILELFAIENIVSLNNDSTASSGEWSRAGQKQYYHINDLGSQSIAEVVKLKLVPVESNWIASVAEWWGETGMVKTLPYDASKGLIEMFDYSKDTKIKILEMGNNKMSFFVDSKTPVPVLIKMTYSNGWKAYINNSPIKIWKVAPCLMLIQASGNVTFKI